MLCLCIEKHEVLVGRVIFIKIQKKNPAKSVFEMSIINFVLIILKCILVSAVIEAILRIPWLYRMSHTASVKLQEDSTV